jgi:hypothetical protein
MTKKRACDVSGIHVSERDVTYDRRPAIEAGGVQTFTPCQLNHGLILRA